MKLLLVLILGACLLEYVHGRRALSKGGNTKYGGILTGDITDVDRQGGEEEAGDIQGQENLPETDLAAADRTSGGIGGRPRSKGNTEDGVIADGGKQDGSTNDADKDDVMSDVDMFQYAHGQDDPAPGETTGDDIDADGGGGDGDDTDADGDGEDGDDIDADSDGEDDSDDMDSAGGGKRGGNKGGGGGGKHGGNKRAGKKGIPKQPKGWPYWTGWSDVDDPSGDGDFEINKKCRNPTCPTVIEVQIWGCPLSPSGWTTIMKTEQEIEINPNGGLSCVNNHQCCGQCKDYMIGFRAGDSYWSGIIFDRDNPSATGDYEDLLQTGYPPFVPLSENLQTEGTHISFKTNPIRPNSWGVNVPDRLTVGPRHGLSCWNAHQVSPPVGLCHDYRVRYYCEACPC